jgi:hypothetical protein
MRNLSFRFEGCLYLPTQVEQGCRFANRLCHECITVASFFAIGTSKEASIEESLIPSEADSLDNQRARRWNGSFPLLPGEKVISTSVGNQNITDGSPDLHGADLLQQQQGLKVINDSIINPMRSMNVNPMQG